MAKSTIRLQAKLKDNITQIKALIKHPMEIGTRRDLKTGKLIPAHFIQELTCTHEGKIVMSANWGSGIAMNPYFAFRFKGGAIGETVILAWKDNLGKKGARKVAIKKSRR
ncbi:MAG: thiosulfate oxidation carrier complex protein SoxZ [Thiomargarita sp.]|nr:thiosulfate oxidation carrier complex protein SoxZ [Thiomargarita sp.]